jgi:hypothetical protein
LQLGKFFFSDFSLGYFELIFVLVLSLGGLLKRGENYVKILFMKQIFDMEEKPFKSSVQKLFEADPWIFNSKTT